MFEKEKFKKEERIITKSIVGKIQEEQPWWHFNRIILFSPCYWLIFWKACSTRNSYSSSRPLGPNLSWLLIVIQIWASSARFKQSVGRLWTTSFRCIHWECMSKMRDEIRPVIYVVTASSNLGVSSCFACINRISEVSLPSKKLYYSISSWAVESAIE